MFTFFCNSKINKLPILPHLTLLKMYDFVAAFIDDVNICGAIEQEHFDRVMCGLEYFSEHGIRLSKQKF